MFVRPNTRHCQVAYVTNDLAASMAALKEAYGIDSFLELTNVQPGEDPDDKPRIRFALAVVAGVEIELIEPVGDTAPLFSDVLPAGEEGLAIRFHHIASRIEGPIENWETHRASLDLDRHRVVFEGQIGDLLRFMYTDERAILGHFVEHVWMSPEMLERMRADVPVHPSGTGPL